MDSKYLLGIAELDSQHLEIETLFIALQDAIEDKDRWPDLPGILERLCEKLRFHFRAEESIMQVFAYPESQEHQKSHLEILKLVENNKGPNLTKANIEKLKHQPMQLFFQQILSQDLRFSAFILRNKERLGIQLSIPSSPAV